MNEALTPDEVLARIDCGNGVTRHMTPCATNKRQGVAA